MKRKIALTSCSVMLMIISFLSSEGSSFPELYAQELQGEAIYFKDGTVAKGIILEINREKIRIQLRDGSIIERPSKEIFRFSSERPFREIYRQAVESEIKKPAKTYKSKSKETEQGDRKGRIISDGMTRSAAVGQDQEKDGENPFGGLWKSEMGSLVKIDGNQGVLIDTPSEPWKKFIHKITIKNIRQQDDGWIAEEWLVFGENNLWIAAEWQLADDRIKRHMTFEGKKLETFFMKTGSEVSTISSDAKYYFNRGVANDSSGRLNEAISDYSIALEIHPGLAEAYHNRGVAYELNGRYDRAISDYSKFIDLNPTDAVAYSTRGVAYFFNKDFDNAWKDITKAQALGCKIHPEFLKMLRDALDGQR